MAEIIYKDANWKTFDRREVDDSSVVGASISELYQLCCGEDHKRKCPQDWVFATVFGERECFDHINECEEKHPHLFEVDVNNDLGLTAVRFKK